MVALESTIFSTLGLPSPANAEALARCAAAIRANGAVPAVTAVVDGVARVGTRCRRRASHPRRYAKGGEPGPAVRDRTTVGLRGDHGLGVAHARSASRHHGLRHRRHRRRPPRRGAHGRHQRRPRCDRGPSGGDGLRGSQGVSRPSPHARAPRDARVSPSSATAPTPSPAFGCRRRTSRSRTGSTRPTKRPRLPGPRGTSATAAECSSRCRCQRPTPCPRMSWPAPWARPKPKRPAVASPVPPSRRSSSPASLEATQGRSLPANLALAEHNASVAAEIAAALCELV